MEQIALVLGTGWWVLLGLAIGSFLNVCIDRIPLAERARRSSEDLQALLAGAGLCGTLKQALAEGNLSIANPARSLCFSCGAVLAWTENLPLVSYFLGGGRCRHCGAKYGWRSPAIEAGNGAAYGILSLALGWTWSTALAAASFSMLLTALMLAAQGGERKVLVALGALLGVAAAMLGPQ